MGHKETLSRSGTCLTPGCHQPRDSGTWYCQGCNQTFRAEQDKRRGTVGTYPKDQGGDQGGDREGWTTFVNGKEVDYDTKISVKDGKALDEPILMKNGRVVNGKDTDREWDRTPWQGGPQGIEWGPQTKGGNRPSCENGSKGHDGRT